MIQTVKHIFELLKKKNWTVSTAESCTGGLIGAAFTDLPGSSKYYYGGIIAYDNKVKRELLNVSSEILESYGAVSNQTALAMAMGVKNRIGTECSVSTTGIAGPEGGTQTKPVGLVFIGIAIGDFTNTSRFEFEGSRDEIRKKSVNKALECLLETLIHII